MAERDSAPQSLASIVSHGQRITQNIVNAAVVTIVRRRPRRGFESDDALIATMIGTTITDMRMSLLIAYARNSFE